MIKINLNKENNTDEESGFTSENAKDSTLQNVFLFLGRLILAFIIVVGASVGKAKWIEKKSLEIYGDPEALERSLSAKEVELKRLDSILSGRLSLDERVQKLRGQVQVVDRFYKERNLARESLVEIAQKIPESTWVKQLVMNERAFEITGSARSMTDVSDFLGRLDLVPLFSGATLKSTQQDQVLSKTDYTITVGRRE